MNLVRGFDLDFTAIKLRGHTQTAKISKGKGVCQMSMLQHRHSKLVYRGGVKKLQNRFGFEYYMLTKKL